MRVIEALVLAGVCAWFVACGEEPAAEPAAETPSSIEVPPLQDYGGIGGDFALMDQRGESFALKDLRGRAAMLFFGYTYCPEICPVTQKSAPFLSFLQPKDLPESNRSF